MCVARRIPATEKSSSTTNVEQFTTRLDVTGKILAIDTSGASATYSQYLNKDLVGRIIQELCHPNDLARVNAHLKEALQQRSSTSGIYRLQVASDKYVHVQTKSKLFNGNQVSGEPSDFIMATHSIIRDSEQTASEAAARSAPSPISLSSIWSSSSASSTSANNTLAISSGSVGSSSNVSSNTGGNNLIGTCHTSLELLTCRLHTR